MKSKLITIALGAFLCSSQANAQLGVAKKVLPVVTLGAKLGVNAQQTKGVMSKEQSLGFVGGIFAGVSKKKMGIRAEGLIKTAKSGILPASTGVKLLYLDIPLLFEYSPIKRLKLHAGPQFTALLSAKTGDINVKNQLASTDFSIAAGAEVNLPLQLTLGVRYIKGFVDIYSSSSSSKILNSSIQITAGYRFMN